ncbi:MAG TPA: DUF2306 domain-containing protein [Burkholderiales bacterium]|nr:DUF2306 domain-containing protein [Burkholderiales bacterium]
MGRAGAATLSASNASASLQAARAGRWPGRVMWGIAAILAVAFAAHAAQRYLVFTESSYRGFWPNRYWLLLHFSAGSLALLCGLLQFLAALRQRFPDAHRVTGRVYLCAVALGAISAFYLSFHSVIGWTFGVATFFLGCAWVATTSMAFIAIRNQQIEAHREWMIRSYVLTFAFVTFRLLLVSPLFADTGTRLERFTAFLWMSWTLPLLAAEVLLQWRRCTGSRRRPG